MVACFDSSNSGCTVATHKFSFKLQLYNNECKSGFDDECVRVQSQPGCGTAVSISAVKIKIERVKVKKRLENSCNTNILMFYLEVGGRESERSLWILCDKTPRWKRMFLFPILFVSVVVLKCYPLYKTILCLAR